MRLPFRDRISAGRLLGSKLDVYKGKPNVLVLALPRGGVPVAHEIAKRLHAPLDVMVVRKLGVPWQPELAMGAVASGGVTVLDDALIQYLNLHKSYIQALIAREKEEIERREHIFRNGRRAPELSGRTVILVDDGAATGSTMLAAVAAIRKQRPEKVIVAVPIASRSACESFEREADNCLCLATPEPFVAVGSWYESFPQVTDEEVKGLLFEAPESRSEEEERLSAG